MTTKRSCNICAEFYNKVNRKEVKCCACDFESCRGFKPLQVQSFQTLFLE